MELGVVNTLFEIINRPNPFEEAGGDQGARPGQSRQGRRGSRSLDYIEKKELERKEIQQVLLAPCCLIQKINFFLQAKNWVKLRADHGSLLVVSFSILEKLSKSKEFRKNFIDSKYVQIFVRRLTQLKDADRQLKAIRAVGHGQFLNLLISEVAEQQMVMLSLIHNLCCDQGDKIALVEQGVGRAVVELASSSSAHDISIQTKCLLILRALSLTSGNTEQALVEAGVLGVILHGLRESFGDVLLLALSVLSNLAFVPSNSKGIVDCGCLAPLANIMKRGSAKERLKAVDVLRNLSAGVFDLRLCAAATKILGQGMNAEDLPYEQKLRSMVALRSLARFEQSLKPMHDAGILDLAVSLLEGSDSRLSTQALGLLTNVLGNTAVLPAGSEEIDSESEIDEEPMEKRAGGIYVVCRVHSTDLFTQPPPAARGDQAVRPIPQGHRPPLSSKHYILSQRQ